MKTLFTFLFLLFGANLLFSQDNINTTIEPNISEENNQKIEIKDSHPTKKTNNNTTVVPVEKVVITNHKNNQSKFPTPLQEEKPAFLIPEKND